jgi:uncharacterized protein YjbI with pentapeptide repeats
MQKRLLNRNQKITNKMIEIKNKSGEVIYTYDGANLRDADLYGTNLRGADTEFGIIKSIIQISNIGSRSDTTVVYYTERGIFIKCGCFKGSLAEFEEKVKETHKGNDHEKVYLSMVKLVKVRFQNK